MLAKAIESRQGPFEYLLRLGPFFGKQPPKLWYLGEPSLLNSRLLGIVSARKIEPDLAWKVSDLMRELVSLEVTFISGWHSPLEEEALRILLMQSAKVIFCTAKSLDKFKLSPQLEDLVSQKRILLLTHCSPKVKRISRDASLRRNLLVAGLGKGLLVLSAPAGSVSLKLAQKTMNLGRAVFTPQHRINDALLSSGALPATIENIQRVFE